MYQEKREKVIIKSSRKMMKSKKGVTLIALIITIIVLLILAGVSIAILTGENGILMKADDAKNKTQIEDVKEQAKLDILAEQMKNEAENLSEGTLRSILDKYFEGVPTKKGELEEGLNNGLKLKSKVEYGGQEVDIGEIYDRDLAKEPLTADELELNKTKIQYVTNYPIDIDGDKDYKDDWEIFYIENYKGEDSPKDGNQPTNGKRIFLIASDYVRTDTLELQQSVTRDKANMKDSTDSGENNYVKYWTSPLPNYNCTLPNEDGENGKKACTFPKLFEYSEYAIKNSAQLKENANSKCAASLLCTENWSSFAKSPYAEYATGGPSIEMWEDSWNEKYPNNKVSFTVNSNYYGYSITTNTSGDGKTDPLYFPHTGSTFKIKENQEICYGYWLASPFADDQRECVMDAHCDGKVNKCNYNYSNSGVRPLVCLRSDIKLIKSSEKIEKDGIETECFELVD